MLTTLAPLVKLNRYADRALDLGRNDLNGLGVLDLRGQGLNQRLGLRAAEYHIYLCHLSILLASRLSSPPGRVESCRREQPASVGNST